MTFLESNIREIVATLIVILLVFIIKYIITSIITKSSRINERLLSRSRLVNKYFNALIISIGALTILTIWGVKLENLLYVISPIFAVIGVALFAQWSILSNVTSGIILFISAPFKIGDWIQIQDKDFPTQAEIEDIKAFHTFLRTSDGELLTYPNNLLLQKAVTILPRNEKKSIHEETEFED